MKLLAIDSSGLTASVAVLEDDLLLGEYSLTYKKTHSQTLLPMIDELTRALELDLSTLDVIAVAGGPGSFTGLRIGSATAKGLAQALNIPIVSVSTLEGLAMNLSGSKNLVCPIMDARRNQTYTGIYSFEGSNLHSLLAPAAIALEDLLEELNRLGQPVTFLGDGVPAFRTQITEGLKVPFDFAPASLRLQHAASVAVVGARLYQEGKAVPAGEHRPDYFRLSQAEREKAEKEHGSSDLRA